jgi:demethylmenaquinone methyltransferase/2-methoxy-6-polyprenyl-1,4-benzoquinol methylase
MFDRIAPRYDLLNRLLSLGADRRWRRRAVASLKLAPGARVLDLASGTGDVALEVLSQCPEARVIGLDAALSMLALARSKAAHLGGLHLVVGDAQALPLRGGSVDAVTMAFGIRNVPDRPRALQEMVRVMRSGSRVAILELGEPRRGLLALLARQFVRNVVPWLGGLLSGEAEYRYLQSSMEAFPLPEEFASIVRRSGFRDVTVIRMMLGAVHLFGGALPEDVEAPATQSPVQGSREQLVALLARRKPDCLCLVSLPAPLASVETLWAAVPGEAAVLWDPGAGNALAGVGESLVIAGSGPDRFGEVARRITTALTGCTVRWRWCVRAGERHREALDRLFRPALRATALDLPGGG